MLGSWSAGGSGGAQVSSEDGDRAALEKEVNIEDCFKVNGYTWKAK